MLSRHCWSAAALLTLACAAPKPDPALAAYDAETARPFYNEYPGWRDSVQVLRAQIEHARIGADRARAIGEAWRLRWRARYPDAAGVVDRETARMGSGAGHLAGSGGVARVTTQRPVAAAAPPKDAN